MHWIDVTGCINAEAKSAKPAPAVTVGYLHQEFDDYKSIGIEMGFEHIKSGSLVRSSYHADEGV